MDYEKRKTFGIMGSVLEMNSLFEKNVKKIFLRNFSGKKDQSFNYFAQVPEGSFDSSSMILENGKKPLVLATFLEYGFLKKYRHLNVKKFDKKEKILEFMEKKLRGKIGINFDAFSKKDFDLYKKKFKKAKFSDVSEQLHELREIKTKTEIKKISKAVKISEKTINSINDFFKNGMTEKKLALKLEFALRENGCEEPAFKPIVASGKNSSIPHYVPQDKKITRGLLLIDFGAKYQNYCSDLTRTFFVGRAGEREKELYSKVFAAKKIAEEKILENAKAKEIFGEINAFLKKECGQELKHGLGHGLGLEVHDFPNGFTSISRDILKQGMVLTVEPGVYKSFGGIRVEDDILVLKKGCKKLSNAPSELIELK